MGISENTVRRDRHSAIANFLTTTGPRIRNYGPDDYRTMI